MPEDAAVAAPSAVEETPAVIEMDPARGALVDLTPEQRTEYKKTGTLPKPEAPAASQSDKPEADAGTTQEHTDKGKAKKPTADERIAQLEATIEKIRAGKERKTEPAAVAEPPKQQAQAPQNYQDWRKTFKPTEWVTKYAQDNPQASYEDAQAAMSDFLDEVRGNFRQATEQQRSMQAELNTKVSEARQRYGDKFDEVLNPTLNTIVSSQQVAVVVKQLINESEVLPDLLFTLGSSQEELNKFLAMPPGKQARYIALTESLIREELEGKEKPKAEPPAKPQTSAPRPPAEVGGRAASPGDAAESAVKSGNYRAASAEWTRQAVARMKG